MRETKQCVYCGKEFERSYTRSKADFAKRAKYCSVKCSDLAKVGEDRGGKFLPCRMCGAKTKYRGGENHPLFGMVHCGRKKCAKESKELKNKNISERAKKMYADGSRSKIRYAFDKVPRVSKEESALTDWFTSIGWVPQYGFHVKGIHTNKLPRYFWLDFANPKHRLYVEIDGSIHRLRKERDARKDSMMAERGWRGLRIPAKQVRADPKSTKQAILEWVSITVNH